MSNKNIREWTVLIYANGNNEYEHEMHQSMLDAEKSGSNKDVSVAIEIGRESRILSKILRPDLHLTEDSSSWTGVRRYYIEKDSSNLVEDLGSVNMADPKHLYDFIRWGMENYPARHYMLILGGHGAAFIGSMTDFSQKTPYIMGTVEMCKVINMIGKDMGNSIDILLLDTCYMNQVEVIYELGYEKDSAVKNVITYIQNGPMEGLPYGRLFDIIKGNIKCDDIDMHCSHIVKDLDYNLICIKLNQGKLKKIKKLSSDLAYSYLTTRKTSEINFDDIFLCSKSSTMYQHLNDFEKELSSIILCYNRISNENTRLIDIVSVCVDKLINIYFKMSFAKNNYWSHLLCNKSPDENIGLIIKSELKPTVVYPTSILALILNLNPNIELEDAQKILNKLTYYKGWKWDKGHSGAS